jgi:truncated hemoglobin YjbI
VSNTLTVEEIFSDEATIGLYENDIFEVDTSERTQKQKEFMPEHGGGSSLVSRGRTVFDRSGRGEEIAVEEFCAWSGQTRQPTMIRQ